jgi:hypothetical protein
MEYSRYILVWVATAMPNQLVPEGIHPELVLPGQGGRARGLPDPDEISPQSDELPIVLGLRTELGLQSGTRNQQLLPVEEKGPRFKR